MKKTQSLYFHILSELNKYLSGKNLKNVKCALPYSKFIEIKSLIFEDMHKYIIERVSNYRVVTLWVV